MRIALGLEYDGSQYHGWQRQNDTLPTVQLRLEEALSKVANHNIETVCAGRTDAGVHALGQVVHFDTVANRTLDNWVRGANSILPRDIVVKWAEVVSDEFHARFSAKAREYRYLIYNHKHPSALFYNRATWVNQDLDHNLMHVAGQYLLGENDFTSFRGALCQSKTPMRNVQKLNITKSNKLIIIDIKANAFLLHMVRNIVGSLLEVGLNKNNPEWIKKVLLAKNRSLAGATAPPEGLYLRKVFL
ncbi:MAG: tRNA pseudouridine(38-40) synthase TruA [Gammaproteobacteria bacterium]|nr:tRNA pseudouridine(38-40) synthase TruA [Gammaproteobacteria bacterium]